MLGLPSLHKKEKIIAVADIGSDSVGVCIAKTNPRGTVAVLSSERLILRFEERTREQTINGILSLLKEACDKTLSEYSRNSGRTGAKPVSAAYAIIHGPWADSKTVRAASSFDREERITDAMISGLAKQALEMEKDKATPPSLPAEASAQAGVRNRLFEASVVRIELNGYPTKKPDGKRARIVSVAALLSECEPAIRAGTEETLQRTFLVRPNLRSGARALITVLNENPLHTHNHIVVDVAGESTDCIVIRKDVAAEHIAVPEGVRTILKRLTGSGMAEETLSLLRMVARDTCDSAECDKLNESLAKAESELVKIFGEAFGNLSAARKLPNELILIVESELSPWLSRFFARIDLGQFTVTGQPFSPLPLSAADLEGLAAAHAGALVYPDLAIAAAFVNSESQD